MEKTEYFLCNIWACGRCWLVTFLNKNPDKYLINIFTVKSQP